jgi:hypothetical protein
MKWFITFSAGTQEYIDAGNRILKQANDTNKFDKTTFYGADDLKNDTEFWTTHSKFVESNERGFGYWIWKSYLIKKTMEQMADGDILLYLDSGCEINVKHAHLFDGLFETVRRDYIIGVPNCYEKPWNKMDTILALDALDGKYMDRRQRNGGTNMFFVCDKTRALVNRWYELCCDYHLIDDSPSVSPNLPEFLEHRHDQAIFSLLTKKMEIYSSQTLGPAIIVRRNRTGISKLS